MAVNFRDLKPLDAEPASSPVDVDLSILKAGILKIAYLGAFEALGDEFLRDPSNAEWQKAIRATTHESRVGIQLLGNCPVQNADGGVAQLPPSELHHHVLSVFCVSGIPLVSVDTISITDTGLGKLSMTNLDHPGAGIRQDSSARWPRENRCKVDYSYAFETRGH